MNRLAAALSAIFASTAAVGLLSAQPADAQRGGVAYATVSLECGPNSSKQPGSLYVYHHFNYNVPVGTLVTVKYREPIATIFFGKYLWVERTIVHKTKHTMISSDPDSVDAYGQCLSATFVSKQPVLSQ